MTLTKNNIKKTLKSFKYDILFDTFRIFKIKYLKKEIECLNNFNINKSTNFRFFGNIKNLTNLNKFLLSIGTNDIKDVNILENIIFKIINKILDGYNTNYFLIDIKISLPIDYYKIPRWHKDGKYFINNNKPETKFVMCLKGPGTLLIKSDENTEKIYNDIHLKEINELKNKTTEEVIKIVNKYRPLYDKKLKKSNIIQLENNDGIIFKVGNNNNSTIHSEPNINKERIFISILPGLKKDIDELKNRYK